MINFKSVFVSPLLIGVYPQTRGYQAGCREPLPKFKKMGSQKRVVFLKFCVLVHPALPDGHLTLVKVLLRIGRIPVVIYVYSLVSFGRGGVEG